MPDSSTARVIRYFETLTPASLAGLGTVYVDEARFKDPFNEVQGVPAIRRIYAHMFETLEAPRFVVVDSMPAGNRCCLVWQLRFGREGGRAGPRQAIRGASHLRYAADGRIELHRDYWDPAEELYEKVPLLGLLMRTIRRRLAAR